MTLPAAAVTAPLTVGTNVQRSVDHLDSWPNLHARAATHEEIDALLHKHQVLAATLKSYTDQTELTPFAEPFTPIEEEVSSSTLRYRIPTQLIWMLEDTLRLAGQALEDKDYPAAVAYLRICEVNVRLLCTWGHAELNEVVYVGQESFLKKTCVEVRHHVETTSVDGRQVESVVREIWFT